MKKAIGVFVGALGMTILLSGSIVLGNAISSQDRTKKRSKCRKRICRRPKQIRNTGRLKAN